MNQQTVYQTVSVQDELPTEAGVYTCYKGEIVGRANFAPEHGFFDTPDGKVIVPIRADYYTHWEKPTTGYFFTPEEFREVLRTEQELVCKQLLADIAYAFNLYKDRAESVSDKTVFQAISESIHAFPLPDFQTFYNQLTESK